MMTEQVIFIWYSISLLLKLNLAAFPKCINIDPKEDTLIVCNTSGSTGQPKGVIHTHFSVVAVMSSIE
jgi:long-subunit acyl-CoA synthetase (AMP-forming)